MFSPKKYEFFVMAFYIVIWINLREYDDENAGGSYTATITGLLNDSLNKCLTIRFMDEINTCIHCCYSFSQDSAQTLQNKI